MSALLERYKEAARVCILAVQKLDENVYLRERDMTIGLIKASLELGDMGAEMARLLLDELEIEYNTPAHLHKNSIYKTLLDQHNKEAT